MRELGVPVTALWVTALLAAMLVAGIASYRFHSAYMSHYFPEDTRGVWRYMKRSFRERFRWLRPIDDPLLERRRRQSLLALVPLVALFLIPFAVSLFTQ
jgi:hypothetical protein